MRKKRKRSKVILPLLLSAIMVMEPAAAATTVYAEESEPIVIVTEVDQTEDTTVEEVPVDDVEDTDQAAEGTDEVDSEQANNQEDEASTENNVGGGTESPSEDVGDQGDSSEAEEGADSDTDVDDEEELPEEELPDEELSDEELTDEEEIPVEDELGEESEEDADKEDAEDKALNGFAGMPSTYKLTSEQLEDKQSLSEHAGEFNGLQEGSDYVTGEIITFADSQEEAELIAKAYNAQIENFEYGILTLKLSDNVSVSTAIRVAADMELNMPAVWPNYYRYFFDGTNDGIEIETSEYELDEPAALGEEIPDTSYAAVYTDPYLQPGDNYQWHHTVIGSSYAWAAGYTGVGVKVAVLDSGVNSAHSDLPNVTSIYQSGTSDKAGHGTHVAGIIAASANGKLGVGVAPGVTLYSGNVAGADGEITSGEMMGAIKAAIDVNADIINMSLGGLGYSKAEQDVVDEAYGKGTVIFAAAGNEGGQTYSYPACYKHVISIGATDKNNERASFSSYNNMVDLSAPGADIWSTDMTNVNGYVLMSGTSMACPVAVGEAAVILGSYDSLKSMTKGKEKVDALEQLMKKNATKAGSGMGSGITSLTKVFGLSTAATKPKAPIIEITPDDKSKAQKVDVKITAQSGTTIYYTTNGKTPAFKDGLPDANAGTLAYSAPFTINNSAKATIKAIAVNESGVSSAVKSESYTLKPYVTKIEIDGVKKLAKGKSIQLSAEVSPAYATNKGIDWKLQTTVSGVTVSNSGKVTAAGNAATGSVTVVAAAKDRDGMVTETYTIQVIDKVNISSVKFKNKSVSLKMPNDKSYSLTQEDNFEATSVDGTAVTAADFKWSSSNKTIATVDANGVVTPVKAGKVTITALANDSSGKKATCTVSVTQLATRVEISGPTTVGVGKSVTLKAEVKPSNTNNKKVLWKLYKGSAEVGASEGISISGKGKVTAKAPASGTYTVRAYSADNEAVYDQAAIRVTSGTISKISFADSKDSKVKIFRKRSVSTTLIQKTVNLTIEGSGDTDLDAYTVSNSNKGIATATAARSGSTIALTITATGKAAGKTNITVASTDGSNKKATCVVTVVNPASGIRIAPSAGNGGYVVRGKSLQLKATVESELGSLSNKNVTWELYKADGTTKADAERDGVKIASNGKVTAKKNANLGAGESSVEYTVRATAKDGSEVKASYTIYLGRPATGILTYNMAGTQEWTTKKRTSVKVGLKGSTPGYYEFPVIDEGLRQGGFTVSSSNPSVISVSYSPMPSGMPNKYYVNYGVVSMAIYKKGSATVTVKAMDGSGKQAKVTFIVQ